MFGKLFTMAILYGISTTWICLAEEWIHKKTNSSLLLMAETRGKEVFAHATYSVIFPIEKCCPVLEFYSHVFLNNSFLHWVCLHPARDLVLFLSQGSTTVKVLLSPDNPDSQGNCIQMNSSHYQCSGELSSYSVYPVKFSLLGSYMCVDKTNFDISYKVKFIYGQQPKCEPLTKAALQCAQLNVTLTTPINPLGAIDQSNSANAVARAAEAMNSKCHRYIMEMVCYSFFPKCIEGQDYPLVPCQEMCDEVLKSCMKELYLFDVRVPTLCLLFPSKNEELLCYHPTVHCPKLTAPKHGRLEYNTSGKPVVTSKVTLHCNTLYKINGTNPRICEFSGDWSGEPAVCIAAVNLPVTFAVTGGLLALILILIALIIKYNYMIKVFLYVKLNISLGRRLTVGNKTYDAYVMHNNAEFDFVHDKVVRQLEPQFKLAIPDRDLIPGHYKMDELERILLESRTVIVVLSQEFLNENWSRWELTQALHNEIEQNNFKVILVLMEDRKTLNNIPRHLKVFLKFGTSIQGPNIDAHFWSKLIYELKHHTKSNFYADQDDSGNNECNENCQLDDMPQTNDQAQLIANQLPMANEPPA